MLRMEPGLTAIVGPNGCGKSNILDAVRWVLGEQRTKELRGSQMQDVIFNGSENRHPSGMSEVSVTFDNADSKLPVDFAEVQITRRIYRSGESEYLMNKAPCRLRDIQELFMDTGIGTQAYSMIGQGKMAMILSQKPEDRRALFEEAAGIIKYKNRKRLAIRRLESAEQNLLRLGDIVAEIERQMRSLKRQVNAAIRYRELSEQLRELEIRAAWLEFTHLTEHIASLREQFAVAQDEYEQLSARTSSLEARHEELDLAKLEIDRELVTRREKVHAIDTEMEKHESQIALLRQQIEFSQNQQKQAVEEGDSYKDRAKAIQDALHETEAAIESAQAEKETSAAAIEAHSREHAELQEAAQQAEANVEAIRARAVERMNARAKAQTELETLDVRLANIDGQLEALYTRQTSEDERRAEILARLEEVRKQETATQTELASVEADQAKAAEEQAAHSQTLRELNERWQAMREEKSSLEARLRSLRELRDNYEGFAVGVRAVMRAQSEGRGDVSGIIGPAGDLISTEKTYERAIEAALGGNINNVIVEDADAAKVAIQFLRKHNAGRVTFLPLDTIRGGAGDRGDSLRNRKGVIGPALDVVQFDGHVQKAVEYLLHSTLIVETLDDAIQIARTERGRYPRMVTLEGEVVTSSGAVTGGRTKHESRGLLGRSAEITELEEKTAALDQEIAALKQEGEALTARIQEAAARARELQAREDELSKTLGELGVTIARQSTELDNLSQSMTSLTEQRDALTQQRETVETQRREALTRADSIDSDDEAFQNEQAAAQEALAEARQRLSVCTGELGDLRIQHAALVQRIEELERDRARQQREYEMAISEGDRRKELLEQHAERQQSLEEAVQQQIESSGALSERIEEARKHVVEAENRRQELLDETEAIDKDLRALREQARTAQGRVHQLELDLRSAEDRLTYFNERIQSEYHIALSALSAEDVGTDEYEKEVRDKLVTELREKLQRMGDVNLMAIEEYEALEKRHEFLTGQCQDLQQAKDALLGVIARSDKRIREMFMETFERVSNLFRDYFRRLFSGGQARIYLLDEDDPLESGIEIEARPPGKKPTSISLLSGGESAMTAIALLFSILKSKPTPFCILDEVDAPLDDANIGRFLTLLEEFSEETQFVVITHNKQTMARTEALYGVTMQERGVSQLISARLDDMDDSESAA